MTKTNHKKVRAHAHAHRHTTEAIQLNVNRILHRVFRTIELHCVACIYLFISFSSLVFSRSKNEEDNRTIVEIPSTVEP